MIRFGMMAAIARAEARLTRRLVRYWIFLALAWIACTGLYLYYAVALHRFLSAFSSTVAGINPRYLISIYGQWFLLAFMLGIVFLAFDVRARDVRERFVEVLDAKPYSNLELILGRYLGLMLVTWIPTLLITAFLAILGLLIGEAIEPWALLDFALFMAVPAYTFTIGLVFLASVVVRFRILSAALVLGLVIGAFVVGQVLPIQYSSLLNIHGSFATGYASDFVHFGGGWWGFAQRLGFVAAGLTLMILAAALHPRLDEGSRGRRLLAAAAAAAVSAVLLGGTVVDTRLDIRDVKRWRAAHREHQGDPAPDILAMTADVKVDPGRSLDLSVELRLAAPRGGSLDRALFTLNPGFEVRRIVDARGGELSHRFESGLLEIDLPAPLRSGEETVVTLEASGRPTATFAYLDAVRHPLEVEARDAALFILGLDPMIFTRRYVALMPGARWLPASGAEVGRGDPSIRPADFFSLDLTVQLPEGWLAAGPGRRREGPAAPAGWTRFRFAPPAPLPEPALIAGRFESRAVEIEGVQLEALLHPSHVGNVDFFADAAGEIHGWIGEKLREMREMGLPYPYDGLTLVEVPYPLRGYGGGWRMDTTFAPPAMVLVRESSFPTARFDVKLGDPETFRDREGGLPRAKREWLERFFDSDFLGGNVLQAASRNAFSHLAAGEGRDGLALEFLCENLASRLLADSPGYFSAHVFDRDFNAIIQTVALRLVAAGGAAETGVSDMVIDELTSRAEVWDHTLGNALSGLDPWKDPRLALDILTLKGGAMARSLLDGMGRERAGALLATLRERHEGGTFTRADLVAAGREIGEDLEPLLRVWMDETDLPGFVLEKAEAFRLPDDQQGSPRYQLLLTVRNDEPARGLLRAEYRAGDADAQGKGQETGESDPIPVPGRSEVEIGLVTSRRPRSVTLEPYLSLNRKPFSAELPAIDEQKTVASEPFRGHREVPWSSSDGGTVAVDDLDPGFSVVDSARRRWWRLGARSTDEATDQGLPVADALSFVRPPERWSRRADGEAWGKYRHTLALVRHGRGEKKAVFAATVPRSGSWELQLHLPTLRRPNRPSPRGKWSIGVDHGSGRQSVDFDLAAASAGWNSLGTFEVAEGDVRVEISDETTAPLVVADAIRWMPAGAEQVVSR